MDDVSSAIFEYTEKRNKNWEEENLEIPDQKYYGSVDKSKAVGSAIPRSVVNQIESKTYTISVRNNKFNPENLKIEKGSIVVWQICEDTHESEEPSLYSGGTRSHVIAFQVP